MRRQGALIVAGLAIAAAGCGSATTSRSGPTGTVQGTFLDYPGPMPANGKPSTDPAAGKATFTDKSGRGLRRGSSHREVHRPAGSRDVHRAACPCGPAKLALRHAGQRELQPASPSGPSNTV